MWHTESTSTDERGWLYRLDSLDLSLVREIESDPTQSGTEIAFKLDIPATTVRRRIQRLIDRKVVNFVAITSPEALGYPTRVVLAIKVYPGKVDQVAEGIAATDNVQHVAITTGRYDIVAHGIFIDLQDLLQFVTSELGAIPGLADVELFFYIKLVKLVFGLFDGTSNAGQDLALNRKLDAHDISILREMELDARQTNASIAKKVGLSWSTTKKKFEAMLNGGVVSVAACTNPDLLGYDTRALVGFKVHPSRITQVAETLASYEPVHYVLITGGSYDVMAWTFFRDTSEMSTFLREKIGGITGVISHETMIQLRLVKNSYKLLTREGHRGAASVG